MKECQDGDAHERKREEKHSRKPWPLGDMVWAMCTTCKLVSWSSQYVWWIFPTTILLYYWGKDPYLLITILWRILLQIVLITVMCINLTMHFLTVMQLQKTFLWSLVVDRVWKVKKKKIKKHVSEFEDSSTFKGNCCQCCFCVDRILLKGFVVRKAPFSGFS